MERDKCIEVADGNFVSAKQTGKVQIEICEDNGKPFIATLYTVLLAPDLCESIICHCYLNEFRTYLPFPSMILHRFLQ